MKFTKAPPILSRIIMAISALAMVGVVFMFVSRALKPVDILPATPAKKAEVFNSKADISKHPAFAELEEDYMEPVPDLPIGRENPFNTIVTPDASSATEEGIAVPRSKLKISPVITAETNPESPTSTIESSAL
ncbi:MAG: hypothetical protein P1P90_00785 [Patescibacteria group bacterium]|nr:hypothetical protein [Patescibacteria group bacterium]